MNTTESTTYKIVRKRDFDLEKFILSFSLVKERPAYASFIGNFLLDANGVEIFFSRFKPANNWPLRFERCTCKTGAR